MGTEGAENSTLLHQNLVDRLREAGTIRTPSVEAAFRAVPRRLFVPQVPPEEVYQDRSIQLKPGASSSQPSAMAILLEQLELKPGHRVMEIGAGTGYNAALMAHLVGGTGQVTTIDIDADLVSTARTHLATAEFAQVQVLCGDGWLGCSEGAPYDRIIVSVGAWDIAPAWREQLSEEGRLLVPLAILGPQLQLTVAFQPVAGGLESVSISECNFMMMQGIAAPSEYSAERLRITAFAQNAEGVRSASEAVVLKPWTRLQLRWF